MTDSAFAFEQNSSAALCKDSNVPKIGRSIVPQIDRKFTDVLQADDALVTICRVRHLLSFSRTIIKKIIPCKIKLIAS